jgi:hypothetical protein
VKLSIAMLGVALAACGVESAPIDDAPAWTEELSTNDGALLGVWGTGPDDVWAVGGQVDRSLVLHNDGRRWTNVPVDGGALLITTYGFTASDVYAVGEHGLILHFDGTAWSRIDAGVDVPLYGVWGSAGDDVWIVGGDRSGAAGSAVVLRGSHGAFRVVDDVPAELVPSVLYKVHGFAADDVVMVGSAGVLRWNGAQWRRDDVPMAGPLFSTWGRADDDLYAVGGSSVGEVLHFDGQAWSEVVQVGVGGGLSGVFTSAEGPAYAVGGDAVVLEIGRDGTIAQAATPALSSTPQLHAVWGDNAGSVYTVGGSLVDYPQAMTGVILRRQ